MKLCKKLKMLLFATLMFFFNGCDKLSPDDELSLSLKDYLGSELRIDGYYYWINVNGELGATYFFFKNGVLLHTGGWNEVGFDSFEDYLRNRIISNKFNENKSSWGLFAIDSSQIKFERWYPPSAGGFSAYIKSGEILNDTTFQIIYSVRSNGEEGKEIEQTFHFRQFSPKPDSTNSFIQ